MRSPSRVGARIRERRLNLSLKQAEVAQAAEISASYLNLIEHNRRRIGGALLNRIAQTLNVDPTVLSEGVETKLLTDLQAAAESFGVELQSPTASEELANSQPEWAQLVVKQSERIEQLENQVAGLSDRLSHDPFFSESLHEILSTVTSIRSTASLLADPATTDPNWQKRFQSNIRTDSERLSDASQALAQYLDADDAEISEAFAPQDELTQRLAAIGYHHGELETGTKSIQAFDAENFTGLSLTARSLARDYLNTYVADAHALSSNDLIRLVSVHGPNPDTLARETQLDVPTIFRRLASLDPNVPAAPMGLVACDGAGHLTFLKTIPGFSAPRVGAACGLWPLFEALTRPHTPILRAVYQRQRSVDGVSGGGAGMLNAYAYAFSQSAPNFDSPAILHSMMLLVPTAQFTERALQVGPSCRICSKKKCPARREPSLLAEGFDSP